MTIPYHKKKITSVYHISQEVLIKKNDKLLDTGVIIFYKDGDSLNKECITIKTQREASPLAFTRSYNMDNGYCNDWYPKAKGKRTEWGLVAIIPILKLK